MGQKNSKNKKSNSQAVWLLTVLFLSFFLSLTFGLLSEIALSGANLVISIITILVFVFISLIADMIGVAVTTADPQPFRAMASRKVRGSKQSLALIKKADRVASICCDVIGDVCGILSGAAGATIVVKIAVESGHFETILIASLVSAVVASLVIFGKAVCKKYAINNSGNIVLVVGKVLSVFGFGKDKKVKSNKTKNSSKTSKKDNVENSTQNATQNNQTHIEENKTNEDMQLNNCIEDDKN